MKARIVNIKEDNFDLIPCPANCDHDCQRCFYWIGKRDAKFDLKEQKRKWLARQVQKYGSLAKVFLLGRNETPVGYIQFGPIAEFFTTRIFYKEPLQPPSQGWCITCVSVDRIFRGRGIAKELVASALKDLERLKIKSVDVYPAKIVKNLDQEPAGTVRLWEKFGFKQVTQRKKDRAFQEDRVIMRLNLR